MMEYFNKYPPKIINRILLITGIIIFLPVYYSNYQPVFKIMDMETLNELLITFDPNIFTEIILSMQQQGNLDTLFNIYILNIISTTGFCLFAFSLTLIIARAIKPSSILYKIVFIFPVFVLLMAFLDFLPSILFLMIAKDTRFVSDFIVYAIDFCYVTRIFILYLVIIWVSFIGIYLIINKVKERKKSIKENNN